MIELVAQITHVCQAMGRDIRFPSLFQALSATDLTIGRYDIGVDSTLLAVLQAADHPKATEFPPGFDWSTSISRVRELKPVCDHLAGRAFEVDDKVQDASFFADIALRSANQKRKLIDTVFALRFSCFGNLFSPWGPTGAERLSESITNEIIRSAVAAGFVFVPTESLDEPYAGSNRIFLGATWWDRFFEYL